MPRLVALLCASALLAFAAACVPTQTGPGASPASESRAERLLRQGNATGAAEMYERLAQNNPAPERNDYAFAAARAWLAANRADDAQRALELAVDGVTSAQQFERELLGTEVAVARGQYSAAWRQVSQLPEPTDAARASRLFHLRQQVALRAGQPVEAVRAGIARERVAADGDARMTARRELLTDLRGAIERGLRVDPAASGDALVRGWIEIAQIAVSAGRSPLAAPGAIERWRTRFPGHPAATIATSDILEPGARPAGGGSAAIASTGPIALLLPLTGRQSVIAGLIRDGFQAAINRLPETDRPDLRVYDTGEQQVGTVLQNAQVDGASFIVGPLTKAEVQAAYEQRPGELPLLLLNTLSPGMVGTHVYQYALAPEDEARQIARQINGSGRRNVVMLAPAGDWGTRVAGAFTDELTRSGGAVIAQGSYDLSKNDLTAAITAALGIDAARARFRRVQQVTGATLQFDARPRPDIDAIFVAGYQPLALRQINPQLRFFNAGSLPTYVTQDGLDVAPEGNRDLEGMWVLDMPWALDSVGPVADLRTATEPQWSPQGPRQSRYFAFGYDAATLAIALRRNAKEWPLAGLTGRLQLATDGRVERSLNWGRLREGAVQPQDPVAF
jgi:outer membrane PBP1 activator LpoA protein